jgi:hypothetical protein
VNPNDVALEGLQLALQSADTALEAVERMAILANRYDLAGRAERMMVETAEMSTDLDDTVWAAIGRDNAALAARDEEGCDEDDE